MNLTGQQVSDTAVAGGFTRPPFLYLACFLVGLVLDRAIPLPLVLPETAFMRWIVGGGLILIGVTIMATGIRNFSRAATPVPSNQPVRALVITGIHSWSRNPIYVGMLCLYTGIGIVARSPGIVILALPLVFILRYGVIAREERYLEQRFGDAYCDYKARVRRWL